MYVSKLTYPRFAPRLFLLSEVRGGSGLIFLGLGQAWVEAFRLRLFGLLKFKIGLKAFKSWALITGLKICKKL
jgi:hypothetical protein